MRKTKVKKHELVVCAGLEPREEIPHDLQEAQRRVIRNYLSGCELNNYIKDWDYEYEGWRNVWLVDVESTSARANKIEQDLQELINEVYLNWQNQEA